MLVDLGCPQAKQVLVGDSYCPLSLFPKKFFFVRHSSLVVFGSLYVYVLGGLQDQWLLSMSSELMTQAHKILQGHNQFHASVSKMP